MFLGCERGGFIAHQLGAMKSLPNGHHRGNIVCRMLGPCSVFVNASKSRTSVAPTNANDPNADPLKKAAKLVQNIVYEITLSFFSARRRLASFVCSFACFVVPGQNTTGHLLRCLVRLVV